MMKLPAQKLLSLARDKVFSYVRLFRVKENWIGEFKSIQSYEEFIFITQYGRVLDTEHETYFLSSAKN